MRVAVIGEKLVDLGLILLHPRLYAGIPGFSPSIDSADIERSILERPAEAHLADVDGEWAPKVDNRTVAAADACIQIGMTVISIATTSTSPPSLLLFSMKTP